MGAGCLHFIYRLSLLIGVIVVLYILITLLFGRIPEFSSLGLVKNSAY